MWMTDAGIIPKRGRSVHSAAAGLPTFRSLANLDANFPVWPAIGSDGGWLSTHATILRLGLTLGVDYALTWSCYQGGTQACGACPTCVERLQAFAEIGQPDPLPYSAPAGRSD